MSQDPHFFRYSGFKYREKFGIVWYAAWVHFDACNISHVVQSSNSMLLISRFILTCGVCLQHPFLLQISPEDLEKLTEMEIFFFKIVMN